MNGTTDPPLDRRRLRPPHRISGACVLAVAAVLGAQALPVAGTSAVGVASAAVPAPTTEIRPPVAPRRPHRLEAHGVVRNDDYYWLRDRDDPQVLAYLAQENAYRDAVLAPTDSLQEVLYREMVGRLEPDDASVPVLSRGYWYYTRYVEGGDYPLHCRRRRVPGRDDPLAAPQEIMLDGNALADGASFFDLRGVQVCSESRTVAYAVDTVGRRFYTWRFRDLATGRDHPDTIAAATAGGVWAEDGRTFLYVRQDPETLRSHQVWRHVLGEDPAADVLLYQENDPTFSVRVGKTRSRRFLLIGSSQTLSDEIRVAPADRPDGAWRLFQPRRRGLEYSVEHDGERFLVVTNHEAPNFRIMTCGEEATGLEDWRGLVAHRDDVLIERIEPLRDVLAVQLRRGGLTRLLVLPRDGGEPHEIDFGEATYSAWLHGLPELDAPLLRFGYSSLTTPSSVFDYDWRRRERILRKRDRVLGDFDPARYEAAFLHAEADDGVRVPISLVWRRDQRRPGGNPCLLYGYGSYGSSSRAAFNAWRLSLLDRGFVFAIAHVRGGQELGRAWYEDGKLLEKTNSFTDFIACGRHLVAAGHADPDRLYAMGGSAGGLLVGAAMNLAPELWDGVVAQVPFVDVVTTMLDETIPLTTSEYDEWGDPRERAFHDAMLAYSPYDQTTARAYPHLLVTAGLHDSQVQYWEPAKWVAKLRALKTNDTLLVLSTNMAAGHGGASGRLARFRETALEAAFLLLLADRPPWPRD